MFADGLQVVFVFFDKICICRRVAKAYARAPVLTVNGSDDGFDGFRFDGDNDFFYDDNHDIVQSLR